MATPLVSGEGLSPVECLPVAPMTPKYSRHHKACNAPIVLTESQRAANQNASGDRYINAGI